MIWVRVIGWVGRARCVGRCPTEGPELPRDGRRMGAGAAVTFHLQGQGLGFMV